MVYEAAELLLHTRRELASHILWRMRLQQEDVAALSALTDLSPFALVFAVGQRLQCFRILPTDQGVGQRLSALKPFVPGARFVQVDWHGCHQGLLMRELFMGLERMFGASTSRASSASLPLQQQ